MIGAITPKEADDRRAAEAYSPRAGELLLMWRRAIETGARVHEKYRQLPDGEARRRLLQKLNAFDAQRAAASRAISQDISSREGTPIDFETVAGTAGLTTDPTRSSTGTVAAASDLGLPIVVWVVFSVASIVGVYAVSKELARQVADWSKTIFWVAIAGGGLWAVYAIFKSKRVSPPRRPVLGETYG